MSISDAFFRLPASQHWRDFVEPLVAREASFFAGANWPEKNSVKFQPIEIREICAVMKEHTHGRFIYGMNFITFEDTQDAMMFNLVYRK